MRKENKQLGELVKPFLKYFKTEEINFLVEDKEKILDKVAAHFKDAKISYLDGIKVEYWDPSTPLGASWWFNLRISNTENFVRLNLEATTSELLEEKKKLITELLENS
jgi:phosphomannomutase